MMKIENINWSKIELNDPVSFREGDRPFIIRLIRNVKGKVMCRCEMDDDNVMKPFETLPEPVQKEIHKRILATA